MIKDKHGYMINLSDGNIKIYGHDTQGKDSNRCHIVTR